MRKIIAWLNAEEVSNDMGGAFLTAFFRWFAFIFVITALIASLSIV